MDGLMMDRQLLISRLLWRAERIFADREVVTRTADGYRYSTYAEVAGRVRKLVGALRGLGVASGDRVLTLAWNSQEHLEAYFAVPGMGAVLHTGNPRLSLDQLAHTINHAEDRVVLVEDDLLPLLESIADQLDTVHTVVVIGSVPASSAWTDMYAYEDLLVTAEAVTELPEFDENTAAALCYTSGTTGDPKGVLYSHRSTVLHALTLCTAGSAAVAPDERFLLATPMSHVNAWGVPYACALAGASMILPGTHPRPEDLLQIVHDQAPTTAVGAVTVGAMMRQAWEQAGGTHRLDSLERLWLGGSAPSVAEIGWWAETCGAKVVNGWGMTETSPMATFCSAATTPGELDDPSVLERQAQQGPPLPLVEMRIVDEIGNELAWDSGSVGELEVRSPWVAQRYYKATHATDSHRDDWLRTGDIGVIHPDGSLQIKDRTKDLVKSGGEWISSVELENTLIGHPAVVEAAVVAVPDPTWVERPLACVVTSVDVTSDDLLSYLGERFPRFWLPDQVVFLEEIPKTSVGKLDKKQIRSRISTGTLESL